MRAIRKWIEAKNLVTKINHKTTDALDKVTNSLFVNKKTTLINAIYKNFDGSYLLDYKRHSKVSFIKDQELRIFLEN
jgi:hypothetical protein